MVREEKWISQLKPWACCHCSLESLISLLCFLFFSPASRNLLKCNNFDADALKKKVKTFRGRRDVKFINFNTYDVLWFLNVLFLFLCLTCCIVELNVNVHRAGRGVQYYVKLVQKCYFSVSNLNWRLQWVLISSTFIDFFFKFMVLKYGMYRRAAQRSLVCLCFSKCYF